MPSKDPKVRAATCRRWYLENRDRIVAQRRTEREINRAFRGKLKVLNTYGGNMEDKKKIADSAKPESKDMVVSDDFTTAVDAAKELGGEAVEDDPIFKLLESGKKYIPLITKFIDGFAAKRKEAGQQDQDTIIPPPEGWLQMSSIQRLSRKYDTAGSLSNWWNQGMAYENAQAGLPTGLNPQEQPPQSRMRGAMQDSPHPSQPRNLQELSKKHGSEIWDAKEVPAKTGEHKSLEEVKKEMKGEEPEKEKPEKSEAEQNLREVQQALVEDNQKYMSMFFEWINTMDADKFREGIKDVDALINTWCKPIYLALLPVQIKESLLMTSREDMEIMFKQNAPEKYKILEEEKKVQEFLDAFEQLKEKFKPEK